MVIPAHDILLINAFIVPYDMSIISLNIKVKSSKHWQEWT
jgi:hypothetical protein